jgi:hypothetical protein
MPKWNKPEGCYVTIFVIDGLQVLHTEQYSKFLRQFWSKVLPKRRYEIIRPGVTSQKTDSWDSRWYQENEFYIEYENPFVKHFCQYSKYSTSFFIQ